MSGILRRNYPIYLFLIIITAAIYLQSAGFLFTSLDDYDYVTRNPHVTSGLTVRNINWAFSEKYEANWIPLTWISLMVDHEIGSRVWTEGIKASEENPRIYHLTNVVLHIIDALLLFALLSALTGCRWRSAFVAVLFAIHPLHVESVAWVTERKDVLSTLFWLLAMFAYMSYTRKPGVWRYISVAVILALGLMSKSMLVTLPFIFMLMDFWPLRRAMRWTGNKTKRGRTLLQLSIEKLPFLALAAATGVITLLMQEFGGAISDLGKLSLGIRAANAVVSCMKYIFMMLWPLRLTCFYPHPGNTIPEITTIGCAVLLIAITAVALLNARRRPYIAFGWFWYLITLLPVIGLIQVGSQGMADRYTYVPLIGLFMLIAWTLPEMMPKWSGGLLPTAAGIVIITLIPLCYRQVSYWRDDLTLQTHALKVTPNSIMAHECMADIYTQNYQFAKAADHYKAALRINDSNPDTHILLADALANMGKDVEAAEHYRIGLRQRPGRWMAANNLADILATSKDASLRSPEEAVQLARRACEATHYDLPAVIDTLASAYAASGRLIDAMTTDEKALQLARNKGQADTAKAIEKKLLSYRQQAPAR